MLLHSSRLLLYSGTSSWLKKALEQSSVNKWSLYYCNISCSVILVCRSPSSMSGSWALALRGLGSGGFSVWRLIRSLSQVGGILQIKFCAGLLKLWGVGDH